MNLFQFLYRNFSARNNLCDYRFPGLYYVTICTKFRSPYFGTVTNGHVDLSAIGKIVEFELKRMLKIRENVVPDEWVIMPNHVHVIFHLLPPAGIAETHRQYNRFGVPPDNLPAVVRGFKSAVKKWTNLYNLEFHWQRRYHDHIIRDEGELKRIQWYIRNNAGIWKSDSMNR